MSPIHCAWHFYPIAASCAKANDQFGDILIRTFLAEIGLFHGLRKFQRHFLMFVEGRSKTFSLKYS